ncbi:MAG TPA: hypothetical protein VGM63_11035 [Mucilaginibacter sp.]
MKINYDRLKKTDFKSKWEKGQRPTDGDCKSTCSKKGVSLSIIKDGEKDKVVKIFKSLFPIAPGYKPNFSIIRLAEKSGAVKSTPSRMNPYHYDLYKSDEFDVNQVSVVEIIPLHSDV